MLHVKSLLRARACRNLFNHIAHADKWCYYSFTAVRARNTIHKCLANACIPVSFVDIRLPYYCSNEYRKDREWEIILKYDFLLSNQTWILFTWVPSRKERRPDAWLIWKKTPIFTSISIVIFVTYTKRQSVSMH